jgi:hypothetical protein
MKKKSPDPKLQQFILGVCAVTLGAPIMMTLGSYVFQHHAPVPKQEKNKIDTLNMRPPKP